MATKKTKTALRKPRSDARENRERILEVAKDAFTRYGGNASLDEIAKQAAVGPGTLYRHFPTRDSLIEAVYQAAVEKLAAAAEEFVEKRAPMEALRAWMLLFVDHLATKRIIAPALNALAGGPARLYEGSRGQIWGSMEMLVKRAMQNGDLRSDLKPFDLMAALVGLAYLPAGPDWEPSAKRLVDILLAGARKVKAGRG